MLFFDDVENPKYDKVLIRENWIGKWQTHLIFTIGPNYTIGTGIRKQSKFTQANLHNKLFNLLRLEPSIKALINRNDGFRKG